MYLNTFIKRLLHFGQHIFFFFYSLSLDIWWRIQVEKIIKDRKKKANIITRSFNQVIRRFAQKQKKKIVILIQICIFLHG